ncbi:mechanosensitive ion channel family protein [Flavobacterium sp. JP2137]|uniref:mechanosensitive ion channel family protein n=1 Tax=Flavobacterium sp. JP2137 TaxID=3414510 RepID=UPI003D2FF826
MKKTDYLLSKYIEALIDYIPNVVGALVILALGLWLIRLLKKIAQRVFLKKRIDPTSISFLLDGIIWALRALLFVTIASKLGIETTSFVAVLGAMSLAIGLSLQGSLANFAGGVLIILFKPFRIGDVIEAQAEVGKVLEIHIFSTKIVSYQNQVIYIPNGILSNGKIKNYSQNKLRKTEVLIQTPLSKNSQVFIEKMQELLLANDLILRKPDPRILIKEVLDTKMTYNVQVWVENHNHTEVSSFILQKGKEVFAALD